MRPKRGFSAISLELAAIAIAALVFAGFCISVDVSERLASWAQSRERYQLDELPLIMLFLAFALAWFAWRRMREARSELARRLAAEEKLQEAFARNRRLAHANLRLQEEERRRLARELHDELGQCVNAIKIEAVALRTPRGDDETRRAAASIASLADRVQAATRDILRQLRPPGIDDLGLAAVLEHCVDDWRQRMPGVQFDLTAAGVDQYRWGEPVNIAVYRLVQEGLTNVACHARPRRVAIDLVQRVHADGKRSEVVLTIGNDGAIRKAGPDRRGLGIPGMRERVEALGGELAAGFRAADEFRLEASLPLQPLAA